MNKIESQKKGFLLIDGLEDDDSLRIYDDEIATLLTKGILSAIYDIVQIHHMMDPVHHMMYPVHHMMDRGVHHMMDRVHHMMDGVHHMMDTFFQQIRYISGLQ